MAYTLVFLFLILILFCGIYFVLINFNKSNLIFQTLRFFLRFHHIKQQCLCIIGKMYHYKYENA